MAQGKKVPGVIMRDIGAFEFGARIIQASSYHSKFLPNNIVDRGATRPWISTGLYPQYFVISFPDQMQIHTIDMKSFNVHQVEVQRSTSDVPFDFENISEKSMIKTEDKLQVENIYQKETTAKHLKFIIRSGYDSFCAVYEVTVMGSTLSGRSPMPMRKADATRILEGNYKVKAKEIQLDVVDNDLYPRHISQGPAVYDPEANSNLKRFQSAFKVPDVRKVTLSHAVEKDGREDQEGYTLENKNEIELFPKPSRLSDHLKL